MEPPVIRPETLSLPALCETEKALGHLYAVTVAIASITPSGDILDGLARFIDDARNAVATEAMMRRPVVEIDRARKFALIAARLADGVSAPENSLKEMGATIEGIGSPVCRPS